MSTVNNNRKKRSEVWNYFNKNENNNNANCLKCGDAIFCKGSSTTALINHLKRHDININKRSNSDQLPNSQLEQPSCSTKKIKNNLLGYVKFESLNEILAKCAAIDGFSINSIKHSSAINGFVLSRGYQMPKCGNTIMSHIINFHNQKKNELAQELLRCKNNRQRFSITTDEWTGRNVKRYLNITLHSENKFYVLSLMPLNGSCDAFKLKKLVTEKLLCFGLDFAKDIIASTNDGASVMQKYGRLIECICQLCFNHSIHLAVISTFYKRIIENNESEGYNDDEYNSESEEKDAEETYDTFDANVIFEDEEEPISNFRPDIGKVLSDTRKIIKTFKNSPVRNSFLQNYVKIQQGKHLCLMLDCKTRWNSLVPMIERFLNLKECIKKALNDIGMSNIYKQENEIVLEDILKVLKPTELAVQELSKEKCTLLTCEGIFKFLFDKLREINTNLSKELLIALQIRMNERRNEKLMTLLLYLKCGKIPRTNNDFTYSSKNVAIAYANEIINRIQIQSVVAVAPAISEDLVDETTDSDDYIVELSSNLNQELRTAISSVLVTQNVTTNIETGLKTDFKILDGTKKRTEMLDNLYLALLTVKPSSTATERVFSTSGNFLTKIRSRLKFESLDALVF